MCVIRHLLDDGNAMATVKKRVAVERACDVADHDDPLIDADSNDVMTCCSCTECMLLLLAHPNSIFTRRYFYTTPYVWRW